MSHGGDRRSCDQSKTAVMSPNSISAKSDETPIRLTVIERAASAHSSWRPPGSHSTSSPPSMWLPAIEIEAMGSADSTATWPRDEERSMIVRIFACPRFPERRVLPALALVASLATTMSAMAQGQAGQFARECALKETTVITLIEDHGAAEDLPADRLGNAGLTMLRARMICYEGRVREALALYDSILELGPVASLRGQRP